jgi:hypothetical protein
MKTLTTLIQEQCAPGGIIPSGGRVKFMEVQEKTTGHNWMSFDAVTDDDFHNLDPGEDYSKFGIAYASMDAALFHHSPNAEGKPVCERVIDGRRFIHVAEGTKAHFSEDPDGMATITVNKAHVLGFETGRRVAILRMPGGAFVECVGTHEVDMHLKLPAGAIIDYIQLSEPWIVSLPKPAETYWWFSKMRSFQGPVIPPKTAWSTTEGD